MRNLAIVGAFLVMAQGAQAQVRCNIVHKFVCDPVGCRVSPVVMWNFVDLDKRTYSRCDIKGCSTYGARISRSGSFWNFEVEGRGLIAKMADDGSAFHEVATLMNNVFISFGSCAQN